jgi:3-oxocholest-4-en-26-oyl-CoA dehydrogenase beta subunit
MDFSFSEEQQTVRELASRILGDLSTHDRLKEVAHGPEPVDRKLWKELGTAGLLSAALPESIGGAGLGFMAAGIMAEEVGRTAAAVPYVPSVVSAALPIARFGNPALSERWLAPLSKGEGFLTAALSEPDSDPWHPATIAQRDGAGWRLDGHKSFVPAGTTADVIVVSATTDDGSRALFVVEREAPGVKLSAQVPTDGYTEAEMQLNNVAVGADEVLVSGSEADGALNWLIERTQAASCLQVAGACQAALKLTAEYTSSRQQFGKPIATFQAVGQRAADAYIDTEAVKLTAWQAAWRLAEELTATAEVATAKFWADDGAQRVVLAAQHLHGGIGVDRDYPLHRYFLMVKHLALTLGGTTPSLLRLGDLLATEPA